MKGLPETLLGTPLETGKGWFYTFRDAGSKHVYAVIHITQTTSCFKQGQYSVSATVHSDPSENWSRSVYHTEIAKHKFNRKIDTVLKEAVMAIEQYFTSEAETARVYVGQATKKARALKARVELFASLRPTIWDRIA